MQTIYIGKNFRKFDLAKNRIYKDRPTEKIKELEGAGYSLASKLFVDVDKLPAAQKALATKGTAIFSALKQLEGGK